MRSHTTNPSDHTCTGSSVLLSHTSRNTAAKLQKVAAVPSRPVTSGWWYISRRRPLSRACTRSRAEYTCTERARSWSRQRVGGESWVGGAGQESAEA